jgi:hypothetical protein
MIVMGMTQEDVGNLLLRVLRKDSANDSGIKEKEVIDKKRR